MVCYAPCERMGSDGEASVCVVPGPVSSGERMRRSSLSSPKARPLRPFPLEALSLEDEEGETVATSEAARDEDAANLDNKVEAGDLQGLEESAQAAAARPPPSDALESFEDALDKPFGGDPVANTAMGSLGLDRGCPVGIQNMVTRFIPSAVRLRTRGTALY
eukprot:jgi/Botrbrau1/16476/Bobra.0142s0070.1